MIIDLDIRALVILAIGIPFSIWYYIFQLRMLWGAVSTFKAIKAGLSLGFTTEEIKNVFEGLKPLKNKNDDSKKDKEDSAYQNMYG